MLARATSDKGVLSHASGYTIMTSRVPSCMVGNIGLSCPVSMCSNVAMHANMHVRSSIGRFCHPIFGGTCMELVCPWPPIPPIAFCFYVTT